ncbi:MAG: hypothetical protein GY706_12635, partial [Bacteroides sp.]|nr:hypothetical protein [Bacteroides sp.]
GYQYDDLYRLTDADNPATAADEAFTYDGVGNRLTAADTTGDWSYNENNELKTTAPSSSGLTGGSSYDYDVNGNMTKKSVDGSVTSYVYNTEDRLTEVWNGEVGTGSLTASYYYDPFGRRLWKEVSGVRTHFHYADEGLVGEYDDSGVELKTYGYKPGSTWTTDPLFMKVGSSYYFYHNDHLGTPQKMTSVNGAVVWNAKYNSFGKAEIDQASIVENNLRFPGQYFDAESGLHYNYHRYYDSIIGRYLKVDPLLFFSGDINFYTYVRNNAIKLKDPLGLKVYRCIRPLKPGEAGDEVHWYEKVAKNYHEYNCITMPDGSKKCDSTSPRPCWPKCVEPGVRSDPRTDKYHPDACEEVWDSESNCVEKCLDKIWEEERPPYWIGIGYYDCQEYSKKTLRDCKKECDLKKRQKAIPEIIQ